MRTVPWVVILLMFPVSGCLDAPAPATVQSHSSSSVQATATSPPLPEDAATEEPSPPSEANEPSPSPSPEPGPPDPPAEPTPAAPAPALAYAEFNLSGPLGPAAAFAVSPGNLSVANNTRLNVTVRNRDPADGGLEHQWVLLGLNATSGRLRPGENATFEVLLLAPGNYTYQCNEPEGHEAHAKLGESGTLEVRPID